MSGKIKLYKKHLLIFVLIFTGALISFQCLGQDKERASDTEVWEPEPAIVVPGEDNKPPSDAIVLFDGTDLSKWTNVKDTNATWKVEDGAMTVVRKVGDIKTIQGFGSCQLHIEFRTPAEVIGESQGRGNSGIFLQERYELQVLDSYENRTYSNGQAGSIYKQHMPLVNSCRKPGEWQTYDVVFNAPEFGEDGSVKTPGYMTVLQNGVLIQNHAELMGPTVYIGKPKYEKHNPKESIRLQDHGNPVSYRNIWVREI